MFNGSLNFPLRIDPVEHENIEAEHSSLSTMRIVLLCVEYYPNQHQQSADQGQKERSPPIGLKRQHIARDFLRVVKSILILKVKRELEFVRTINYIVLFIRLYY